MKRLYVLGNGFDLWHGLPTSYCQFYEYAKDTLDDLADYYMFDLRKHQPWHDFENALGHFDSDGFFDLHNEVDVTSDYFRPRDIYGLEDEITEQTDRHVSAVRETFTGWVNQIDISAAERKLCFPEDAIFITFNYTSTLQAVYGVEEERVFHIHGQAQKYEELIFGHGEIIVEMPEFDEDGESTRDMFSDARSNSLYPLYALRKPVDEVIQRHSDYFENLADIKEIVIIGHSLNEIDQPYYTLIAKKAIGANWLVCCYSEEEEDCLRENLLKCGVPPQNITLITYDDLSASHRIRQEAVV